MVILETRLKINEIDAIVEEILSESPQADTNRPDGSRDLTNLTNLRVLRDQRARSWCFTYNNPPIDWQQLHQLLEIGRILKLVGQRERGESGTEHYQGVVQYENQIRFSSLKAVDPSIHWEPCRNLRAALKYATKDDTRIDGPWSLGWKIPDPIRHISHGNLRHWQSDVLQLIQGEPNDRLVYWLFELGGGVGKTAFAKYLAIKHGALVLGGRGSDIKYGVGKWIRSHGELRCAVFHFTRSVEGYVSYQAIEEVKDGIFYSSKYESEMVVFNPPFILCLANFPPEMEKLSADRWKVGVIRENFSIEWNRE